MPENLLPEVRVLEDEGAAALYNDPELTRTVRAALAGCFGADRVATGEAGMGAEDFAEYGRTPECVPVCMFLLGATSPERYAAHEQTGAALPALHTATFAPPLPATLEAGVTAMTAAALGVLNATAPER